MRHPDQPRPAGGDGIEGRDDALTHRRAVGVEPPVELHERGVDREEAPPVVHDDEPPSLVPLLNLSLLLLLTLVRYTGGGTNSHLILPRPVPAVAQSRGHKGVSE